LGYIHGTAHAKKKYLQFEDLFLVLKRVNEPLKDPYWILKEGPPPSEKKHVEEVVEIEHWNVDALAEYLTNPANRLIRNKKDVNDRLLTWVLREAKGLSPALHYCQHLDKLGSSFESIRMLTLAIRKAIKIQEDLKVLLTSSSCKLLKQVNAQTPLQNLTVEHTQKLYEAGEAGIWTLDLVKQLAKDSKTTYNSIDALTKAVVEARESAHDALMEIFGDVDCILLNTVDNVTQASLNDLLQASGTKEVAVSSLHAMNDGGRTFFKIEDLLESLRAKTGVPAPY